MIEDKQIAEMRNDLIEAEREFSEFCRGRHCQECEYYFARRECKNQILAEKLTSKGYRKASEVAREIFEEIEKLLARYYGEWGFCRYDGYPIEGFDELKNKYTER